MLLLHVICGVLLLGQLALLAPLNEPNPQFVCVGQACYSISWASKGFSKASSACSSNKGHLMTVKNSVQADAIAVLMDNVEKDHAAVWIGLQQPEKERCTDPFQPLRGFTWVTGDRHTDYTNWRTNAEQKCGALCASVRKDGTWGEADCTQKVDGYLCEFNYSTFCNPIKSDVYSVTYYHIQLGFANNGGLVFPPGTHADLSTYSLFCQDKGDGTGAWSSDSPGAWNCLIENGGCEHDCEDISGSPECKCPPGSQLKEDNRTCTKPCDPNPCSQLCDPISDPPGFFCMCSEGYNLAGDGITCEDIDDCAVNPNVCEEHCTNTIGGFECGCKPGFEKVEDDDCKDRDDCKSWCQDINECDNPATLCEHSCENNDGGYQCVCDEGFIIDEKRPHKCKRFCNTTSCEAECDANERDKCQCPDGYIVDENDAGDPICTDVDECDAAPCDGICINTFGSYQCICPEGFTISQTLCIPPEEGSGWTPTPSETPPSTTSPPDIHSLQPAMLLGICIGIISMLTVLIAILCHMLRKHYVEEHALDYKCKNTDKDVVLQQVKSEPQRTL